MKPAGAEAGASLIEFVVAMGVFSLVLAVGVAYLQVGTGRWRVQQERLERQQQARIGLAMLAAELSEAGRGDETGEPIDPADPTAVGFTLDGRRILYRAAPQAGVVRLLRSVDGGTNEVAYGLGGLTFTYVGSGGESIRTGEHPVAIRIRLASSEILRSGGVWRTDLETEVRLRNGR